MKATAFLLSALLVSTLHAQDKSSTGYVLNWNNTLDVKPDSLLNGKHKLPAFAFTVYEVDSRQAVDLWKTNTTAKGGKVISSNPNTVIDATVDHVDKPGMVMAQATKERSGDTRMVVAFASNDSTSAVDLAQGKLAALAMAVQLNRAVVQAQIDDQQKVVDKYNNKLENAQKDEAKAQKQTAKANSALEKAQKENSKLNAKQADLQSEQLKAQKRYDVTKDPKDLKKLTKISEKLVQGQKAMAKQLKKEASALKDANDKQDDIPDAQKEQQEQQVAKEKASNDLDALKRKKESVR